MKKKTKRQTDPNLCRYPPCGLTRKAKGYCITHYYQVHRGQELSAIGSQKRLTERQKDIEAICARIVEVSGLGLTARGMCEKLGLNRVELYQFRDKLRKKGVSLPPMAPEPLTGESSPKWAAVDNEKAECIHCPLRGHKSEDCDLPARVREIRAARQAA